MAKFPFFIAEDTITEAFPPFDTISNPAYAFLTFTALGNEVIILNLGSVSIIAVPDSGSTEVFLELL